MSAPVMFSIIIPVYNVERYLRECLESVFCQTSRNYEIIIVNDCSPDNSEQIINEYLKKLQNVTYIRHKENLGLGAARNSGMNVAAGNYWVFLDSDDTLTQDAIERLEYFIAEDQSVEIIRYNYNKIGTDENVTPNPLADLSRMEDKDGYNYLFSLPCYACMSCVKAEFITEYNLTFLDMTNEDVPWTTYIFANAKVSLLNKRIYNYRIREGSISTNKDYNINEYIYAYRIAAAQLSDEHRRSFIDGCAEKVVNYCSFFFRQKGCHLTANNSLFLKQLVQHVSPRDYKMLLKKMYLRLILMGQPFTRFFCLFS